MKTAHLIFPHQLFEDTSNIGQVCDIFIIEEFLFFKQYFFHQQKIAFHRATMKYFTDYLESKKYSVSYIESSNPLSDVRQLITYLANHNYSTISYLDPTDEWLSKRIITTAKTCNIELKKQLTPLFIFDKVYFQKNFLSKKKLFQTSFYIDARKQQEILCDGDKPLGDKWTFDQENRLKYPKKSSPPIIHFPSENKFTKEAKEYVSKYFDSHYGSLKTMIYPTTHQEAKSWFEQFLKNRFKQFGDYEDAIVSQELILHHSVLSPLINVGLLNPHNVINETLDFAKNNQIPINSLEGFIRQLLGWREFIRGVYEIKGVEQRTKNFWQHKRKIPLSFYTASTGIPPVDMTIKKVLQTGYCHHIERLMVLSNFMLLCEFDPDEVYKWFMELFIDAYDWVMVPNVYGMSQFADGGIMSTKPYISGSNYLMKMSDYPKGEWQTIWDSLFWRFMDKHRGFFSKNPRLNMLVKSYDKMDVCKKSLIKNASEDFLSRL